MLENATAYLKARLEACLAAYSTPKLTLNLPLGLKPNSTLNREAHMMTNLTAIWTCAAAASHHSFDTLLAQA